MAFKIDSSGDKIADVINARIGQRPGARLIAFLQAWDLLRDELGRPPSVEEYAKRFALTAPTAYRDRRLFEDAFPGQTPEEVLDMLWGWHDSRGGPLFAAPVIDADDDIDAWWLRPFIGKFEYPPDYLEDLRNEWER